MKQSNLSKLFSASVIAASLSIVPLTFSAQAQDTAPGTYVEPNGEVETVAVYEENDFDWGWLGLLGLIGLAGLMPKKRREPVHHINEPDVVVRPGSDYRR
ncbi:MAG: WGxxGxxG family protein [Cyanobacteriota bacterium]